MNVPLFTVVIAHYNQFQYLDQAVQSVVAQTWPEIELIIADDASLGADWEKILADIRKECGKNIIDCRLCGGEENVGTVQNLNRAAKTAKGKYILFFAADDSLYDENVLSNFADKLEKMPPDGLCVTAQCLMMDEKLEKETDGLFTQVTDAVALNGASAVDQYQRLAQSAFYGLGCSAMCLDAFNGKEIFDSSYRLIEDWPFFLQNTRNGKKVYFTPFSALKHRDGGISHNTDAIRPAYISVYMRELRKVYEKELLPYMKKFSIKLQNEIMERYLQVRKECQGDAMPGLPSVYRQNKKLFIHRMFWKLLAFYPRGSRVTGAWIMKIFVLWILLGSLGMVFVKFAPALGMAYVIPLFMLLLRWICPAVLSVLLLVWAALQVFKILYQIRLINK